MKLWRDQPTNWQPQPFSANDKALFFFAVSGVFLLLAFVTYISPNEACTSTSRWCQLGLVLAAQFKVSSNTSMAFVYSGLAAISAFVALVTWVKPNPTVKRDAP